MTQPNPENCSLDFIQTAVAPAGECVVSSLLPVLAQPAQPLEQVRMSRDAKTAVSDPGEIFGGIKTEGADVAQKPRAHGRSREPRGVKSAVRVRAIFNDP